MTKNIMIIKMEIIIKIITSSMKFIKMVKIIKIMEKILEIINIRFQEDKIKKIKKRDDIYKK
jgi:hypothetical protein